MDKLHFLVLIIIKISHIFKQGSATKFETIELPMPPRHIKDLWSYLLEHSNSGKKSFDSIRFDFRYRIDFFRFYSIRQSDKFAVCTLIFK